MLQRALHRLAAPQATAWLTALLALLLGLAWLDPAPDATREHLAAWFVAAKVPFVFGGDGPIGRPLVLPLPGGLLLLGALAGNLLAAAVAAVGPFWRTLPARLVRVGAGLAAAAAAVSPHVAVAGELSLCQPPGDLVAAGDRQFSTSAFATRGTYELALLRDDGDTIAEWVVPARAWRGRPGLTVRAAGLPFRVEVHHPSDDCEVHRVETAHPMGAIVVGGAFLAARSRAVDRPPMPGAYVKVVPDAGAPTDGIVVGHDRSPGSRYRAPFVFTVDGRRYGLDLRPALHDLPFALALRNVQADPTAGLTDPGASRAGAVVRTAVGEHVVDIARGEPLRAAGWTVALAGVGSVGGRAGEPATAAAVFRVAVDPTAPWWMAGLLLLSGGWLMGRIQQWTDRALARAFAARFGLVAIGLAVAAVAVTLVPAATRLDAPTAFAVAAAILTGSLGLVGRRRRAAGAPTRGLSPVSTDLATACAAMAALALGVDAVRASGEGGLSGLTGGAPVAVVPGLVAVAFLQAGAAAGPGRRWAALLLAAGLAGAGRGLLA